MCVCACVLIVSTFLCEHDCIRAVFSFHGRPLSCPGFSEITVACRDTVCVCIGFGSILSGLGSKVIHLFTCYTTMCFAADSFPMFTVLLYISTETQHIQDLEPVELESVWGEVSVKMAADIFLGQSTVVGLAGLWELG